MYKFFTNPKFLTDYFLMGLTQILFTLSILLIDGVYPTGSGWLILPLLTNILAIFIVYKIFSNFILLSKLLVYRVWIIVLSIPVLLFAIISTCYYVSGIFIWFWSLAWPIGWNLDMILEYTSGYSFILIMFQPIVFLLLMVTHHIIKLRGGMQLNRVNATNLTIFFALSIIAVWKVILLFSNFQPF